VATSPANRARTTIGVGEEVELTYSTGSATWTSSGGGALSSNSGSSVTYTAPDTAQSVTITATGGGCTRSITFTIVEPSDWTMVRVPGTVLKHRQNRPDCSWLGLMHIHPNNVNFYRVETREMNSHATGTGCFSGPGFHNATHQPASQTESAWFSVIRHTDASGSEVGMNDHIYSGDPGSAATGSAPPFTVGTISFPITWQWEVVGSGTPHNFPQVRQESEVFSDGRCETRKGGHTEQTMYTDPSGAPF